MVLGDRSAGIGYVPDSASKPALPQRAGSLLVRDLIDLYMGCHAGRDSTQQRAGRQPSGDGKSP